MKATIYGYQNNGVIDFWKTFLTRRDDSGCVLKCEVEIPDYLEPEAVEYANGALDVIIKYQGEKYGLWADGILHAFPHSKPGIILPSSDGNDKKYNLPVVSEKWVDCAMYL